MPDLKPDFTAWFVLQGLLAALHRLEFQDHKQTNFNTSLLKYTLPLATESSKARLMSRFIHALPYAWQYRIGDFVTNPGRLRQFYLRKLEIEKQTRQLIAEENITQIIILGAGMDVLSLRLAEELPTVIFIEIDQKFSQDFKRQSLEKHHITIPKTIEYLDGNLLTPLRSILSTSKVFNQHKKTLWIAEGFFMFIPEDRVRTILEEITTLSSSQAQVIFTTLPTLRYTSTINNVLQNFYLKKESCPYQWAIPISDIDNFLNEIGFHNLRTIEYAKLHQAYINKTNKKYPVIGENIHITNNLTTH